MKRLLILLLVIYQGCSAADALKLEKGRCDQTHCLRMSNSFLQIGIAPAASASIFSIRYLPGKNQLVAPFSFRIEKDDLLPDILSCNNVGGRVVLWGNLIRGTQEFKVVEEKVAKDQVKIAMEATYYQQIPVALRRELILRPDSTALEIRNVFRNQDQAVRTVTPWENMLPRLDAEVTDEVIMPSRAGVERINGRGVKKFVRDQLWREKQSGIGAVMTAAARNWIARRNKKVPLVFAVRTSWKNVYPEGMFYSWHNESGLPWQTSEIIFNARNLQPGEQYALNYEYLVFPGLKDIREITGPYGLDCRRKQREIEIELASVQPVDSGSLTLQLVAGTAAKIDAGTRNFRNLKPGTVRRLHFPLPELKAGTYRVDGRFSSGEVFSLLEPMISIP